MFNFQCSRIGNCFWDSQARLFYYNVLLNTWTLITTDIRDQYGKDVDSIFRLHGSGDAAIDGSGDLMMLPSSATKFGVFRLKAPLPKTAVASITVSEVLAMTAPPAKFVGIALNAAGQIFLNTVTPDNRLYRLENDLSLTFISNLSLGMDDLTSCNFPFGVLPISFSDFSASLKQRSVLLNWNTTERNQVSGYTVQYSHDAVNWFQIGYIKENSSSSLKTISFWHGAPAKGNNCYRIALETINGQIKYSEIKTIVSQGKASVTIWPNPVQTFLYIQNSTDTYFASKGIIFDQSGRKIKEVNLVPGLNNIDLKVLVPGRYIVSIQSPNAENYNYKLLKE